MASGIDLSERNADVRPQDDLFRHVNGAWLDRAAIPDDRASDGTFHRLRDQSEERVRDLLDELAEQDHAPGSEAQQVGDLYASFLDEDRIEALDVTPITDDLAAVEAVASVEDLARLLGRLVRTGGPGAFALAVYPDAKDPEHYGLYLTQDGIGLPDEAFYRDDQFAEVRTAYTAHVAAMLALVHVDDPAATARRVMELETRIAGHHWDNVRDRDATATYNPMDRAGLDALTPSFPWAAWLEGLGADPTLLDRPIVREPDYFQGFDAALTEVPLADWKAWLTWQIVHDAAAVLSSRFVDENFAFYGTLLTGAEELRDRWKRGVGVVEGALGEALGKLYVARHFPPEAKDQMLTLVDNLLEAYRQSITRLDWMTEETEAQGLDKFRYVHPEDRLPGQVARLHRHRGPTRRPARQPEAHRLPRGRPSPGRAGKPVDREWFASPQTVNAYYNPVMNEIVFPAAILQPPFFAPTADDAVNYGGIGAVIGHEIGHGFDDQGSRYDGDGNLVDWWTESDRTLFEERTAKLIAQHTPSTIQPPRHRLTTARSPWARTSATSAGSRSPTRPTSSRSTGPSRPRSTASAATSGSSGRGPRRGAPSRATPRSSGSWRSTRTRRPSSAATRSSATSTPSTRRSPSAPTTTCTSRRTSASPSGDVSPPGGDR